MELDLKQIIRLAQRWWWLLILMPVITGATAYTLSGQQTPQYSATAMIRVNPPASAALDINALQLTQDLTETYRQLIMTWPVLQAVIDTLDLSMDVDELTADTSASAIPATQLVQISVSNSDPRQAALIANTIAATFAAQMANEGLLPGQSTGTSANQAVGTTGSQSPDSAVPPRTQVTIAEPAVPPAQPYAPRVMLNSVLGVLAGLVLACGIMFLGQYFDNSVDDQADLQQIAGAPVLATVWSEPCAESGVSPLYTLDLAHSPSAEAVRLLRANLEFATAGKAISSLAVSSPGMGEGKSTVSANLAVVLAQAGMRTVLIDADLRRPTQHKIFGVSNERGLTRLLTHAEDEWRTAAQPGAVPNLMVIPSGPLPPNPADLLSIDRFHELLEAISHDVDMVVIDTPPLQTVSDALVVARQTDAALIVARAQHTRREAVRATADALRQGDLRLLGVVLNRKKIKGRSGYYYAERPARRGLLDRLLGENASDPVVELRGRRVEGHVPAEG